MHRLTRTWTSIFVATLLSLAASRVSGQAFGDHDQVLTIGAAELVLGDVLDADGYLDANDTSASLARAPLLLPEGAEIRQICLYSDDRNSFAPSEASLFAVKLVPGGGASYVLTIPGTTVDTTPGAGLASYCTDSISYTLRSVADLDGDGTPDAAAYYVNVFLASRSRIGGVRVTWRRQVSPPPAVATFADVPASDGAFQDVEALVAAGITAGCGNGNYCPGSPLTRRQMAVYLAKALGLHWPN